MTAILFPASPSVNDVYTFNNRSWTWNGTGWVLNTLQVQSAVDVQTFTSNGTWNKPAGAKYVQLIMVGGGGGGGAGRKGAANSYRSGGGGGGSGAINYFNWIPASVFASSENVVVGLGGAGGPNQSSDSQPGADGTIGGDSTFGSIVFAAPGGSSGLGGDATGGGTPYISTAGDAGGAIGTARSAVTTGVAGFPGSGTRGPGVGGAGGGIPTGNTANNGSRGTYTSLERVGPFTNTGNLGQGASNVNGFAYTLGFSPVSSTGTMTNNGISTVAGYVGPGGGGSGGYSRLVNTDTSNGGAGGLYGAGGGGGGAGTDTVIASGAGGKGGDGIVQVITWI